MMVRASQGAGVGLIWLSVGFVRGRTADAKFPVVPDADAAAEIFEFDSGSDLGHRARDRARGLMPGSDDEYPGVGSWRIGADVTEATIQGDQKSLVACGPIKDIGIIGAGQRPSLAAVSTS